MEKIKIRKIITACVIVVLVLLCCYFMVRTVLAEEGAVFHIEGQKGKAGDIITVPVQMTGGEQVGGFEITVYYDGEAMVFQDLQKGELIAEEESLFDYNHKEENHSVKIVYVVAESVQSEGNFVNLVFQLKKDCEDTLPIGVDIGEAVDSGEDGQQITVSVTGVDEQFQQQAAPNTSLVQDEVAEQPNHKKQETEEKENTEEKRNTTKKTEEGITAKEKNKKEDRKKTAVIFGTFAVICSALAGGIWMWLRYRRK